MIDINTLSPAARLVILREKYRNQQTEKEDPAWTQLADRELLSLLAQVADDFAKGSPNSAGWHFANIMDQIGIRVARPYAIKCQCGRDVKVNQ